MTLTGTNLPASAAHRGPDGRFQNPWPNAAPHDAGDLLRWRRERAGTRRPDPDRSSFPRATPGFALPRAPANAIVATWIGHSTVLVQIGGRNVLTDPMWSDRASPVPWLGPRRWVPPGTPIETLPPIDLVLLSHNHYDHLDVRTVRALAARHPQAQWAVPLGLAPFVRRLGVRSARELDWWESADLDGIRVASTPAQHFSARGFTDQRRTLWCGWSARIDDRALYFAGDTGYHPEFRDIAEHFGPFDLVILPIGAYEPWWFMRRVHMNPDDAVAAYRDLVAGSGPAPAPAALGVHWGTFKLTDEPMDEPPALMRDRWRAGGLPADDLWILAHGETRRLVR